MENIWVDSVRMIVVTQSCDLANGKADHVSLCPVYSLDEFEAVNPDFKRRGAWENVRKGRYEGLYLIPSILNPANNRDALVIDFGELHSLPFSFLLDHAQSQPLRHCLDSPYLEHFSQAFARHFMRVGLPSDLPPYT